LRGVQLNCKSHPVPSLLIPQISRKSLSNITHVHSIRVEIDGGVKVDNVAAIARAGADTFVAGSAIYGAGREADPHRYDSVIAALRAALSGAQGDP
jgi:pentose-5-phosphate-3-epimerase